MWLQYGAIFNKQVKYGIDSNTQPISYAHPWLMKTYRFD